MCAYVYFTIRSLHYIKTLFIIYYQPLSPKDERIVPTNPSPDAAITGPSRNVIDAPRSSDVAADNNMMYPSNNYGSLEQTYFYGGQSVICSLVLAFFFSFK